MTKKVTAVLLLLLCLLTLCACKKEDSATSNAKMTAVQPSQPDKPAEPSQPSLPAQPAQPKQAAKPAPSGGYELALANGDSILAQNSTAIVKMNSLYDCDIQSDRQLFSGEPDIVVGDNFFATQINDWYMNPASYLGRCVEIEGFYINEFAPYDFIGRYGPVCQYCQGGYVCYEILTDIDMSGVVPISDWVKLKGVLRQGTDAESGGFGYIEVLELEVCPQPGMATVTN